MIVTTPMEMLKIQLQDAGRIGTWASLPWGAEQLWKKGWDWAVKAEGEVMGGENPLPSTCSPKSKVSQAVAEVSPALPSSLSPTLCSSGFTEALTVVKGLGFFFVKTTALSSETVNTGVDGKRRER